MYMYVLFLVVHVSDSHYMHMLKKVSVSTVILTYYKIIITLFVVKYLGLLAMSKILTVNPKAVQVHK